MNPSADHRAGGGPTVWLLDLQALDWLDPLERWHEAGLISTDEMIAAQRYRHHGARSQFLAGRAVARHAVTVHTRLPAREVAIVADRNGKPRFQAPSAISGWRFNLSHSGTLVACAFAQSEIGVDVETTSRHVDRGAIARSHFSRAEADWIDARSGRRIERFTLLWTLKEAYLKAVGVGISVPLDGFEFSAIKRSSCRVQSRDLPGTHKWHCRFAPIRPDYWLSVCSHAAMERVDLRWLDERFY
jgi:4'-phosphopantetheinyl transferase